MIAEVEPLPNSVGESDRDLLPIRVCVLVADQVARGEHADGHERQAIAGVVEREAHLGWADLDEAFRANQDPLTGRHQPEPHYRALFSRIVNVLPAPIGLGPER